MKRLEHDAFKWQRHHALALLALFAVAPAHAEPGVLEVTVNGVQSAVGQVLVAVCDRETFLQPTCRYHGSAPARSGRVVVRVSGIPPGIYAAQAFQDEAGNKRVKRNFFGIPTEPLGFSNNAPMNFGPPSFTAASFTLGPYGGHISFRIKLY